MSTYFIFVVCCPPLKAISSPQRKTFSSDHPTLVTKRHSNGSTCRNKHLHSPRLCDAHEEKYHYSAHTLVSLQLCLTLQDQLILASLLQASLLAPPLSFESRHHHQLSRSYFEEGAICAT